ncbi:aldo/keto reductase [Weissella koreensis]|uniref:Aldo/keto reductase n=1 Tax=Weissella koreensis TaxID=165096 RepID=A0A7H1MMZ3_9LACO|nr:aldo/keto reductase [Weissella koreensis]AVH75625.1 aldo/keto reductase [Weissella koreensis]EJF34612.1 2,5-diketo-D-gluconic acid reductase [Weissella koreensis KCTC 3621]QGN20848.1 aldo/keto reductase [Weissella koreensis]QNT64829.1 aldo/keto reductase [Weissella koreensis]
MSKTLENKISLNNGKQMPQMGLGVYQIPEDQTAAVVEQGIINGYRLIDTAQIYHNEIGTGVGIKAGLASANLKREDLFITSKIWNRNLNYEESLAAVEDSLTKLQLDYLDLYLIHWPGQGSFKPAWQALETMYKAGKIKAIGVSNFNTEHLATLDTFKTVEPVINQIELHPALTQLPLRSILAERNIVTEAWSPLMQGKLFTEPLLVQLAEKYHKNPAQIILKWDLQQGLVVITKSVNPDRLKANADLDDFELTAVEVDAISALNQNVRVGPDPAEFDF